MGGDDDDEVTRWDDGVVARRAGVPVRLLIGGTSLQATEAAVSRGVTGTAQAPTSLAPARTAELVRKGMRVRSYPHRTMLSRPPTGPHTRLL